MAKRGKKSKHGLGDIINSAVAEGIDAIIESHPRFTAIIESHPRFTAIIESHPRFTAQEEFLISHIDKNKLGQYMSHISNELQNSKESLN